MWSATGVQQTLSERERVKVPVHKMCPSLERREPECQPPNTPPCPWCSLEFITSFVGTHYPRDMSFPPWRGAVAQMSGMWQAVGRGKVAGFLPHLAQASICCDRIQRACCPGQWIEVQLWVSLTPCFLMAFGSRYGRKCLTRAHWLLMSDQGLP